MADDWTVDGHSTSYDTAIAVFYGHVLRWRLFLRDGGTD